jgi:molybdopterin biosynthesis enzyme
VKALSVQRASVAAQGLTGRVLCHDVRSHNGKIVARKGARLDGEAAATLLSAPWEELHLIELEPGDLHEEEAGQRLSGAVVGEGVEVKGYSGGQWSLVSIRRGLFYVREEPLAAVNAVEGISVFTLYTGQPVEKGEVVARAKVTPLVIAEVAIEQVEATARAARGLMEVKPFGAWDLGAVARESLEETQRRRFEASLTEKVNWFGCRLLPIRYAVGDPRAVARELTELREAGARLLIVAGASALDPLDPVFSALSLLGARMERHGAPAHPGSLLWLAFWDDCPVLGMPTCGMFSEATTFDLILPRLLAGETVRNREIAGLGHGGLLSREMAFRFPPYRPGSARGELPE